MSSHPHIDELLALHASDPTTDMYETPKHYHCVVPQRRMQPVRAMIAVIHEDQPAHGWYLPLTAKEHIIYPDHETARAAAVRLCVQMGVPIVTPLRRDHA